jgi:hypothetical protein
MDQPPSMMPQGGGPSGVDNSGAQQAAMMAMAQQTAHPSGHAGKKHKHHGRRGKHAQKKV